MQFKLKQPLPFILKEGLTEGYIEDKGGIYKLVSGDFKQNLKASQFQALRTAMIAPADDRVAQPVKETEDVSEEPKAETEDKETKGRGIRRK